MSDAHERAAISHPLPATVRPNRERRAAVLLDADARCSLHCSLHPIFCSGREILLLH